MVSQNRGGGVKRKRAEKRDTGESPERSEEREERSVEREFKSEERE